jgi:hypothetical protein
LLNVADLYSVAALQKIHVKKLLTGLSYNLNATKAFLRQGMAMRRAGKNGVRSLIVAACSGALFAAATFTLYRFGTGPSEPLTTASVTRSQANNGIVLMPDGEGNCHKYIYRNDTGKSTYAGIVACDASRSADTRANLPPALRGMQDSLRTR